METTFTETGLMPLYGTFSKSAYVFTIIRLDLDIWNGGSNLDNGEINGAQGGAVSDDEEESLGAYLLVNWDDDNGDGITGGWSTDPTPDLNDTVVENEDNLAQIQPNLEPMLDTGTVELEVSGADKDKIKLWKKKTKETEVTLTSNKKTWDLSNSTQKSEFEDFMANSLWIEGIEEGSAERAVTFTLRYKDSGGTEICNDVNKATVVLLRLGMASYRMNSGTFILTERGHAALLFRYIGLCTKEDLSDDGKYDVLEMAHATGGPTINPLSNQTEHPTLAFTRHAEPPDITYVQRLKIIKAASYLEDNGGSIWYVPEDIVEYDGFTWDGTTVAEQLDDIDALRCDGVVEVCYELSGVNAWGRIDQVSGAVHYSVYTYTGEHNDMDWGGIGSDWRMRLWPHTQCAYYSYPWQGVFWDTKLDFVGSQMQPVILSP